MSQCSVSVTSSSNRFHSYPCSKKAVVQAEDGKLYCKQHDPKEVKKRDEKGQEKFKREQAQRAMGWVGCGLYDALELLVIEGSPAGVAAAKKALRNAKPYRQLLGVILK